MVPRIFEKKFFLTNINIFIRMASTVECPSIQPLPGKHHADDESVDMPQSKKIKVNKEKYYDPRPTGRLLSKPMIEKPEYFIENGLIKVRPYWFQFASNVKGRWMGRKLKDVYETEIYSRRPDYFKDQIKLGRMKINQKNIGEDYILKGHDVVTNVVHRHELPVLDKSIKIIVNNDDYLVIEKPCSLPCHPCGRYYFNTLTIKLENEHGFKDLKLCHRLDRLTSGILIFAKHSDAYANFKKEQSNGKITKQYVARVVGEFPSEHVVCDEPIGCLVPSMGIRCVNALTDSKSCLTKFERVNFNGTSSVVRCYLETGRTHQIRVHLQYLGYPIVNDYLYNDPVWGPTKGKGGDYGKPREELINDLKQTFSGDKWILDFEQSVQDFMELKKDINYDEFSTDNFESNEKYVANNLSYDPLCTECHLTPREPTEKQLEMFLHCLKYECSEWSYSTDLPDWAQSEWTD